jgi:hypothetical protein
MNTFIESLKRLFNQNKITIQKLDALLAEGKITESQYQEITG